MNRFSDQFRGKPHQPETPKEPLGADSPDLNYALPESLSFGVEDITRVGRWKTRLALSREHGALHPDTPNARQLFRLCQVEDSLPTPDDPGYDSDKAELLKAVGGLLLFEHHRQAVAHSDLTPRHKQLIQDDITAGEERDLKKYESIIKRRPDLKTVLKRISQ